MLNQIFNENCFETLSRIENGSLDMVFADPPFNINKQYNGFKDKNADYYGWCYEWVKECFRALKDTGTFYLMTIDRHLPEKFAMMKKYGVFINLIKWRNVSASHDKRRFWNSTQPIMVYGKTDAYKFNTYAQVRNILPKNMRWGGYSTKPKGQLLDYWDDIPFVYAGSIAHPEAILKERTNQKEHPCQMPTGLVARAMLFSTDEGDTVYDPFIGSGTTAIACLKHKRNFIGSEVSPEVVLLAERRIKEFKNQGDLFVC
ncbi:MAG: DNA adenine methyltransferase YhdJ [Syntrophomonadaceae bacterium]|nr:DNA adenine methyltransferase YhdJ [Bacillota bacterium]